MANPYAGLLTVPAAHLWLVVLLASTQPSRRVRGLLLGLGALPALLVATYYWFALSMDPLSGAWYLLMLVTGHTVGLLTALVGLRDAGRAVRRGRAGLPLTRRGPGAAGRRAGAARAWLRAAQVGTLSPGWARGTRASWRG